MPCASYGLKKPHIYYEQGYWFCVQRATAIKPFAWAKGADPLAAYNNQLWQEQLELLAIAVRAGCAVFLH